MTRPTDWSPLAGSDPVPGDADELAALALRYRRTADAITSAATALDKIHDSGTAWEGESGTEFAAKTRETADAIRKAYDRYDGTAEALSTYATSLGEVQDEADALLRQAKAAQDDLEAAERARDGAEPDQRSSHDTRVDDARSRVDSLVNRVDSLRDRWDSAGNTAASRIEDITENDGLKDGFWDDVDGVVAAITDVMGKLSALFGVLALICAVVPGLQPFAALFGALALITGLISLAGNLYLKGRGDASWGDVLWDLAGVLSFGAGRAFTGAARGLTRAARGMAKPAFIRSLRAGGTSSRQAKIVARSRDFTGGGRAAKSAARAYKSGSLTWRPRASDWKFAFTKPFTDVAPAGVTLTPDMRALPEVSLALRRANVASGVASGAGVVGSVADGRTLGPIVIPEGVPIFGADRSPVER